MAVLSNPINARYEDIAYEHKAESFHDSFLIQLKQLPRLRVFSNPVITQELIVRLRKKSTWILLALFLLAACGSFLFVWHQITRSDSLVGFDARSHFIGMTGMFFGLLFLFIPIINATAINTEREKDTWDLLCATRLNLCDILAGKWIASTLHCVILLCALFPLYGISAIIGGISALEIIAAIVAAFEVMLAFSLLGMLSSTVCKNAVTSLLAAYLLCGAMMALFFIPCDATSPINTLTLWLGRNQPITASYIPALFATTFFHWAFMLGLFILLALATLYKLIEKTYGDQRLSALEEMWREIRLQMQHWRPMLRFHFNEHYSDGRTPVHSREIREAYGRNGAGLAAWTALLIIAGVYALSQNTSFTLGYDGMTRNFAARELFGFIPLALLPLLAVPYSTGAFLKEFNQDTWPMLRSTRLSAWDIIRGKLLAGIQITQIQYWAFLSIPFITVLAFNLSFTEQNRAVLELMLGATLLCLCASVLYTSVGLWLSLRFQKMIWSFLAGIVLCWAWAMGTHVFSLWAPIATIDSAYLKNLSLLAPMRLIHEHAAGNGDIDGMRWWGWILAQCAAMLALSIAIWRNLAQTINNQGRHSNKRHPRGRDAAA